MVDTNPHTESRLVSKASSREYQDNYDKIFRDKKEKEQFFIGEDAEKKANLYLKEVSDKNPNLEFIITYKDSGILITTNEIKE